MKTKLTTILLLLIALAVSANARTVILTLQMLVRDADAIVVATATTQPKHGEIMFARYEAGHLWWESPDATPLQVTNALTALVAARDEFAASTNDYASRLINIPLWHHQRVWDTGFRVSHVLKGHAHTNIVVRLGLPYTTDITELKKGQSYILFLNQWFSDVNTPDAFTIEHMLRALPVAKEYKWSDRWTTLEIGKPFKPLALREETHDGPRKFTHEQFLNRIKQVVREQREEDNK